MAKITRTEIQTLYSTLLRRWSLLKGVSQIANLHDCVVYHPGRGKVIRLTNIIRQHDYSIISWTGIANAIKPNCSKDTCMNSPGTTIMCKAHRPLSQPCLVLQQAISIRARRAMVRYHHQTIITTSQYSL